MIYTAKYWTEVDGANWQNPIGPASSIDDRADHPVVHMSWNDAHAYAKWAGKRLPSEAEWELASRGKDYRLWPWGDNWVVDNANTAELHGGEIRSVEAWKKWWIGVCATEGAMPKTTSVCSFSPSGDSPYGVSDMAGNVYEWTSSISSTYDNENTQPDIDIQRDPMIEAIMGKYRVIRGGSWMNLRYQVRCAERLHGDPMGWSNFALGFRCASDIQTDQEQVVNDVRLTISSAWAERSGQTTFDAISGPLDEVIKEFAEANPAFSSRLLDEDGEPVSYYNVCVNGELVLRSERASTTLSSGDKLTIISPLAGG